MKISFKLFPGALLLLMACSKPKEIKTQTTETEVQPVPENTPMINGITGVVTEIQPGKDGYTAKVNTTHKEMVWVTISRSNLSDPKQYRWVNVGDTLHVIGEEWEMNNETHLKALQLK